MKMRIGLVGLGFIGKVHLDTFLKLPEAEVVAVSDVEESRLQGRFTLPDGGEQTVDFSNIRKYAKAEDLYNDPDIDVVDINLPTFMHLEHAKAAMAAGKHVICEKPMALNVAEAEAMLQASRQYNRHLYIAHCIRFWPSYAKAKEIIDNKEYGNVLTARFNRISPLPSWSWKGWLQKGAKSGLAALDFHIHDADFVQYVFGKPKSVRSFSGGLEPGRLDHIITDYEYSDTQLIVTEGAWEYASGYSFGMNFTIALEKATLAMNNDLGLNLYTLDGKTESVQLPEGDGYFHEMRHFLQCIKEDKTSEIAAPESALNTIRLVEAEIESAKLNGERIPVDFSY